MKKQSFLRHKGTPGRKAGNVPVRRSAFNFEFACRIREAREGLRQQEGREVTQREICERLSKIVGYTVSPDDYRKYEIDREHPPARKPTMMPHDLIVPFAEITGLPAGILLGSPFFESRRKAA